MKLQVKRNQFGILQDVSFLEVSTSEWVTIQRALETLLKKHEDDLKLFEEILEKECGRGDSTRETEIIIDFTKNNIQETKAILESLKE